MKGLATTSGCWASTTPILVRTDWMRPWVLSTMPGPGYCWPMPRTFFLPPLRRVWSWSWWDIPTGDNIRLPFVGAVLAPGQGLLPHYDYGPFTEGGTTMIVNGGLGESLLPVRFNLRPEIVLVTLVAI